MRKFLIGTILSLTLVLGVTIAPSTIVKAAEPETAWKTWDYDTSNSIRWWSANDHEAVQDGEYLYYATAGNHTSEGAQYQTVGSRLSYGSDYIYCGSGGASEAIKSFTSGGVDYVIHQVPLSEIYDNMPTVKSDLISKRFISLNLDPVYSPLIEGDLKASVTGLKTKSYYACTTFANTAAIPNEWSTASKTYPNWSQTALNILYNSFDHRVLLMRPASLDPTAKTTPKNRGINYLTGIAKADIKAGDPQFFHLGGPVKWELEKKVPRRSSKMEIK